MQNYQIITSLTISQLTALIATHYPTWQVCFLNDNGNPVIGILPKVSWCVYHDNGFIIYKDKREKLNIINEKKYSSNYLSWQDELIKYANHFNVDNNDNNKNYINGFMGFIGYDMSANYLNNTIQIKSNQPCGYMGHYDICIKPNNDNDGFVLFGDDDILLKEIFNHINLILTHELKNPNLAILTPLWSKSDYNHAFYQTQDYIKAGDTYQINLTQSWQGDLANNLSEYLPSLMANMNAPFAGYLKINDFELLSVSPELFFTFYKKENHSHIITKPIKGTRPRHNDKEKDELLKAELKNSEKDISENLMIVDLLRNDLGKYAKIGKVKTPVRFDIESFSNVHHMVSTIKAELKDEIHPIAVLFGSLPAGSITGTPKKRACEIIHELEIAPRGAYCGTMGFMNFDGTGQFNVLIRTLQAVNKKAQLWAGGGITIGSNIDDEYQECTDKVGAIMQILAQNLHDK